MQDNKGPFFGDDTDKRELYTYLASNIKYPEDSLRGVVLMSIVVDVDGSVSDVKIINRAGDPSPLLEEEIIRVFNSMPKWTPYINQGKPEKMQISFPLSFKPSNKEQ
jgi:protein TonB